MCLLANVITLNYIFDEFICDIFLLTCLDVQYQGPLSLNIGIRTWIDNYINIKSWDMIIDPCPNFNGGFAKLPLKFSDGWVITFHRKQWMWLLIHALVSVSLKSLRSVSRSAIWVPKYMCRAGYDNRFAPLVLYIMDLTFCLNLLFKKLLHLITFCNTNWHRLMISTCKKENYFPIFTNYYQHCDNLGMASTAVTCS